eukprot:TRINITY_DN309_c0_g1_i1.p1 TRINITY_DN309_c0_g1~~TRINITY_DN309_c0_g1_i1.p1  ORF type:complete len:547 (+),score=101.60 TRINITY_DN309_c0_g1_i1:45-1685(+)
MEPIKPMESNTSNTFNFVDEETMQKLQIAFGVTVASIIGYTYYKYFTQSDVKSVDMYQGSDQLNGRHVAFSTCINYVDEPVYVEVEGGLPYFLEGNYLKGGAGVYDVVTDSGQLFTVDHWFDGISVMHKFEFCTNGAVKYSNKKMNKETERYIKKYGRWPGISFGEKRTLFQRIIDLFSLREKAGNNLNVTIKRIRNKFYNLTDTNKLQEFDVGTLKPKKECIDYSHFDPELNGTSSCAHGLRDLNTGEYINFSQFGGKYKYFSLNDDGSVKVYPEFTIRSTYNHSFLMTENYIIHTSWPFYVSLPKLLWRKNVEEAFKRYEGEPSKFYVISRETGEIVSTYAFKPGFAFHTINAFELGEDIVLDFLFYEADDFSSVIEGLHVDNLRSNGEFKLGEYTRCVLPNILTTTEEKMVEPTNNYGTLLELPAINIDYHLKDYTYVYGIGEGFESIVKLDTNTGETLVFNEEYQVYGEPKYVPDPEIDTEDGGVLLSLGTCTKTKRSYLVIIDAVHMELIAKCYAPSIIPMGFHAKFIHPEELDSTYMLLS